MTRAAEIVIIGNEILSGKVPDDNGAFLVRELRELGVQLTRVTVIPDDVATIATVVAEASRRADFVLTTGGVGPTLDDVTFEGVARGLGVPLVRSDRMAEIIRAYFKDQTAEAHMKMAMLPAGAELLLAEGMTFPVVRAGNVHVLPGSPEFLRRKFRAIRERFREPPFLIARVFTKADEGRIAGALDRLNADVAGIAIGSYPVFDNPRYAVQITLESKDRAVVDRALKRLLDLLDRNEIVEVTSSP